MIGIVLCSRGMVFTEVLEAIEKNMKGIPFEIYYSHDLPIPDCQNVLVERALAEHNYSHILFVEEDVVMPDGTFEKLLLANANIACMDYGVQGWGCVTKNKDGEILWCGLGCTLIERRVFEGMDKPWFRSDIELRLNDWTWVPSPKNKYGGQDIYFCVKAREKGFTIKQVDGECRHLKLDSLGQSEINRGLHNISDKPKISKTQVL